MTEEQLTAIEVRRLRASLAKIRAVVDQQAEGMRGSGRRAWTAPSLSARRISSKSFASCTR